MWCPLPWSHVGIKNNGSLRMCSHSQSAGTGNTLLYKNAQLLNIKTISGTEDIINSDTLKEVRKDIMAGKWPSQCQRCKLDSETGINSRDQWETKRHSKYFTKEYAMSITDEHGTVSKPELLSTDVRIGNQCNLRCVMCFPGESTMWYKDYKEILGYDSYIVDDKTYNLKLADSDFDWANNKDNIDLLVNMSPNLRKIKFGGGEPLIIKYHHYLLEELIAKGYSKNIELEYSVNLTIFPPKLFDLWKHFKVIKICASVDAYDVANDAIRYPSKWKTIENNLRMLDDTDDNIIIFTSTTVSLLSLEHFSTLLMWIENQKFKKINKSPETPGVSHLVYHPEWLNINLLDANSIDSIFSILSAQAANYPKILKRIESYRQYCIINQLDHDTTEMFRQRFAEVFFKLAKNQNQDWSTIFPMAYNLTTKWNKQ